MYVKASELKDRIPTIFMSVYVKDRFYALAFEWDPKISHRDGDKSGNVAPLLQGCAWV